MLKYLLHLSLIIFCWSLRGHRLSWWRWGLSRAHPSVFRSKSSLTPPLIFPARYELCLVLHKTKLLLLASLRLLGSTLQKIDMNIFDWRIIHAPRFLSLFSSHYMKWLLFTFSIDGCCSCCLGLIVFNALIVRDRFYCSLLESKRYFFLHFLWLFEELCTVVYRFLIVELLLNLVPYFLPLEDLGEGKRFFNRRNSVHFQKAKWNYIVWILITFVHVFLG